VDPDREQEAAAEQALIERIADGDRQALRELYAGFAPPLFALALRLVGDRGLAEELLQDTFIKIWRHAEHYDSEKARPFTWAVTILRRGCIDALRHRRRRPDPEPLPATETPSSDASAFEAAAAGEDVSQVRQALSALPPEPRRALELVLFSGLTQTEIAARLRRPLGTVKSWIRRGLLDLRNSLTEPSP